MHRELKQLRLDSGLSLREVSAITGISNPYLSQMENLARRNVTIGILKKLVKVYGLYRVRALVLKEFT